MTIVESIRINADAEKVFEAYVHHIDSWWTRRGTFRYSFAPETTEPRHIRFDARLDGRFYEEFADGSHYTIGRITLWDPPAGLAYTWKAPEWPATTTITVRFTETSGDTEVEVTHEGVRHRWRTRPRRWLREGLREILGGRNAWVLAQHK